MGMGLLHHDEPIAAAVHLCVDMQRLFGPGSPWAVPWAQAILPGIARLAARHPARTVFTRFIPPPDLSAARGRWRDYYAAWPQMLRDRLDPAQLDLMAPLDRLVPPARVIDKASYSPWLGGRLHATLRQAGIGTLVVTGAETEICVLATVMGAVDLGYRVIFVSDATGSSADPTHEAALAIYRGRLGQQIETAQLAEILELWRPTD